MISINYNNAFGGQEYEQNPIGKGYVSDNFTGTKLPNIELPQQLITSTTDKPNIAGFEPYPPMWPQRNLSTADVNASIIRLKDEVMPIHFNSAPIDQRLNGFFSGNEKIEIKNMHPRFPIINSELPGLRFRAFAVQQDTSGQDAFLEMSAQADTLWLLPNMECGILIFRAICPISNIEADDIKYIYCAMESIKENPKPAQYYLDSILSKNKLNSNHHITTANVPTADNIVSEPIANNVDETMPQFSRDFNNIQNTVNTKTVEHIEDLSDQTINEEEIILELIRNAQKGIVSNEAGLNPQIQEMLLKINEMITQFKLTESDTIELMEERKKSGLSAYPTEEEIIENFREVWEKDPKMEATLREKMQALKTLRFEMLERIRRGGNS